MKRSLALLLSLALTVPLLATEYPENQFQLLIAGRTALSADWKAERFEMRQVTSPEATGKTSRTQCSSPARVGAILEKAAGWIVLFGDTDEPDAKTAELAKRHEFKVDEVYVFGGFYARELSEETIAALRCEPAVKVIEPTATPHHSEVETAANDN